MRWSALLVCLLFIPSVAAQGATTQDVTVSGHEGIDINARLYTPAMTPAPAILLTHGWNDNIDSANTLAFAQRYADQGYVVLSYDSRGWGKSGGEVEMNGPNEVKDTQALLSYLATLDTVVLDGPDDPRVAMIGQSYSGGIQFLTAQEDPRIDAIAPFATWSNLLESLAPNEVTKRGWVDLLFGSGQASARGFKLGETDPNNFDPNPSGPMNKLTQWYAEITVNNGATDEVREELGVIRSLAPATLTTPTYLVQGWPDTLFTPDNALATYQDLRMRGVDVRIAFIDGGHGFGDYNTAEPVMTRIDDFFALHLRDQLPQQAPYPVLRYRYAEDDFVGEMQWPPAGTAGSLWYLTDDGLAAAPGTLSTTLTAPPVPAYCTEVSNFQGDTASQCGQGVQGTFHTFATPPLEAAQELTGSGQVLVPIKSTQTQEVFLFFQVVDVAPDGTETSVLAQVQPFRDVGAAQAAFVTLPAVTHTFEAGHRIAVKVTTTDLTYHGAREPGQIELLSTASNPALVLLPITPKDAHGDRIAPTITRQSSFGQSLATEANNTQVLQFDIRDDLAVGPINVTGTDAEATMALLEATTTRRLIEVTATTTRCGVGSINVTVTDLAGNPTSRVFPVVPCPAVVPTEEPETPGQKSPGTWFLVPVLAAAFLRRRLA